MSTKSKGNGSAARAQRTNTKKINLALQGGGAHGAFAWGVLDRLLEEKSIEIDGIVGTSAGAMNAAVAAYGLTTGGAEGGRQMLRTFWKKISDAAKFSPLQPTPWGKMMNPNSGSLATSIG